MKYLEKIEKVFMEALGLGVAEFERMYDALCEDTLMYLALSALWLFT